MFFRFLFCSKWDQLVLTHIKNCPAELLHNHNSDWWMADCLFVWHYYIISLPLVEWITEDSDRRGGSDVLAPSHTEPLLVFTNHACHQSRIPASEPTLYPLCWRFNLINWLLHRARELWVRDAPGHVGITLVNHFLHVQHVRTHSVGNKSIEEFWEISHRTPAVIAGFGKPGKHRIKPKKIEKVVLKRQETLPMTPHLLRCHCSHSFHPRFRRSLLPLPHCRAWWLLSNGYRLLCHNVLWLDRSRFLCLFFCLFLLLKWDM